MSHGIVDNFKKKLDTLQISDYHGLISPGLTCYLNSVLQVLFMTEEFRDAIKSEDMKTIDTHLNALFTCLEEDQTNTHELILILGIADVYEQRDAAEYFEKILRLTSHKASKIFKGELNYVTRCCKCNTKNNAPGSFWILPLSIKDPHQTFSVEKGLEAFFKTEKVSGENQIFCTQCEEKQDAIIKCEMTQPPDVLTLLLKRFHYDYRLRCNVKLDCEAEVPHVLQIKDCSYELYAIVKHYGTLSGGHYTASIYSFQTKEWYYFNDNRVKLLRNYLGSEKAVRSHASYLLMYKKKSRDPENMSENEHKADATTSDAEAEERRAPAANNQMETNYNRYDFTTDNDGDMFPGQRAKNFQTVRHGLTSPRPQRKQDSPEKSKSQMSPIEALEKRMKTFTSLKGVHTTDFGRDKRTRDRYSPQISRKLDRSKIERLPNVSRVSRCENIAKPWN